MRDLHAKIEVWLLWKITDVGDKSVTYLDGVYSSEYHVEMRMDQIREIWPDVRFKHEAMVVGEPRMIPQEVKND